MLWPLQYTRRKRAPEIDFRYETKATKVMVDFKFDALQVTEKPFTSKWKKEM